MYQMPRVRGRARGRLAGGRGKDDHASAASVPGRGRGRRGRGQGAFVESSSSSGHEEVIGSPPPLQAMTEAMRDVARAIRDEILPYSRIHRGGRQVPIRSKRSSDVI